MDGFDSCACPSPVSILDYHAFELLWATCASTPTDSRQGRESIGGTLWWRSLHFDGLRPKHLQSPQLDTSFEAPEHTIVPHGHLASVPSSSFDEARRYISPTDANQQPRVFSHFLLANLCAFLFTRDGRDCTATPGMAQK